MICFSLAFGALGTFVSRIQAQDLPCTAIDASCSAVTPCCYNVGGFQTGTAPPAGVQPTVKLTVGGSPMCGVDFTGPFG
jgi:hypothetical protein